MVSFKQYCLKNVVINICTCTFGLTSFNYSYFLKCGIVFKMFCFLIRTAILIVMVKVIKTAHPHFPIAVMLAYVIFLGAVGLFGDFSQTGAQAKAFEDSYKNELAAIRYGLDAYDNIYSLLDEVEQQEVPRDGQVDLESSDGNIYGEIPDDHGRINELWEPDSRELDNSNTRSNREVNSNAFNLMQVSTAETTKPTQAVPTMAIPTTSKDISSTLAPRTTQSKVSVTTVSIPVILPTLYPATPMPGGKKVLKFCEEGQKSTREKPCKKFRIPFCRYGKKSTTENPCKPRLEFCKPNQKSTFKNPCEVRWCRLKQRSTQNDPCKKISLRNILKEVKGRGSKSYIKMKVKRWLRKMENHRQERNLHKQLNTWVKKWNLVYMKQKLFMLVKKLLNIANKLKNMRKSNTPSE